MRKYNILLVMAILVGLTSCDRFTNSKNGHILSNDGMQITSMSFSPYYDTITVMANVTTDLDMYEHNDSNQLQIKAYDLSKNMIPMMGSGRPQFVDYEHIGVQELKKSGLTMTVLVDMTVSSQLIMKQQEMVKRISHDYAMDNLFLAFMLPHGRVTHIFRSTPYIINNYITADSRLLNIQYKLKTDTLETEDSISNRAYLYRGISNTITAMQHPVDSVMSASTFQTLLVLSDGVVYNDIYNTPIDSGHYEIQKKLLEQSRKMSDKMSVCLVNLATPGMDVDESTTDNTLLRTICMQSGGDYYDSFDWERVQNDNMNYFGININEYILRFSIKNGRLYFGETHFLKVNFTTAQDSVLACAYNEYRLGNKYVPLIVGPVPMYTLILFRGLVLLAILALLAYIILQLIYPYVMKRLFYKKNTAVYSGNNMSVNGIAVPHQCYYCKTPFVHGDRIIVACEHVMHESCWHENGDHCPEYGSHCKTGGHRYNSVNILDPHNAPFILKWILYSLLALGLCWVLMMEFPYEILLNILDSVVSYLREQPYMDGDIVKTALEPDVVSVRLYRIPRLFFFLSFTVTLVLSYMVSFKTVWWKVILNALGRAMVAMMVTTLAFVVEFVFLLSLGMYDGMFIMDWIPISTSVFAISICIAYDSRLKLHLKRMEIGSVALGIISAFLFLTFLFYDSMDALMVVLMIMILITAGVLWIVAQHLPYHDHYTLRVSGATKEMDIALYKWLRQSPNANVTIGRSVDCSLQLSWDLQSRLAPVHVVIRMYKGRPQIVALDDNVLYNNRKMKPNAPMRMFHGDTFQIGKTHFRYVDK